LALMSYGFRAPHYCRVWLPDAVLGAGDRLHHALVGQGAASNFAHLQKKYPHVRFNILGKPSLAVPPQQRLHVEAQSNDPSILGNVETDLVDLAETACDVAGDTLGMSDDQVQDVFEMIRVEKQVSDVSLPPQSWAPQAYSLEEDRPIAGASAKKLPQKRQLPLTPLTPPPQPIQLAQPQPAPVAEVAQASKAAPPTNGSSGINFIKANVAASTQSAAPSRRKRGSRGPWGEAMAQVAKASPPPPQQPSSEVSNGEAKLATLDLSEDLGTLPDLDEASTPEMELDEEELADSLRLALGSDFDEASEAEKPPLADSQEAAEVPRQASVQSEEAVPNPAAAKPQPAAKKSGSPAKAQPPTAKKAGSPAVPPVAGGAGRKLPPVPLFEAKPTEGAHNPSEANVQLQDTGIETAKAADAEADAQMEAATEQAASSSASSSGSDDEDGEEEDDEGAEDMEVDDEAQEGVDKEKPVARSRLFKLGEFCCTVTIGFSSGCKEHEKLLERFDIDQRIKIDRCRVHIAQAGSQVTVWQFTMATKRGRAPYQALCDYFIEKERVGLVDTSSYYMYVVPPSGKFLPELGLPAESATLIGIQVPKDRAEADGA